MPKSKPHIKLSPTTHDELKKLKGSLRHQVVSAIDLLAQNVRPSQSKLLNLPNETREIRRLRYNHWRIIYVIIDEQALVLGVRRRPPYDYDDVAALLEDV